MQISQRMTAAVIALSLVLAGLVGGVAVPAMLSMRSLIGEIAESQRKIDERFAAQRYVRNAMSTFGATIERVGTLSSTAVREGQELELVTAIETAADARGVTQALALETVNQKELSAWEKQIPVRISASGQFPDILRFLSDIERLPYLVAVSSVQISGPREGSAAKPSSAVTAIIDGTVYWQSAKAPGFAHGEADVVSAP